MILFYTFKALKCGFERIFYYIKIGNHGNYNGYS